MNTMIKHANQIEEAEDFACLAGDKGIEICWGGGSRSKGHGYWMRRNGEPLMNDGKATGNPYFWRHRAAVKFVTAL